MLPRTSWDATVAEMEQLIASTLAAKAKAHGRPATRADTIVIGAGPTGLSAAYHLGEDCMLLEQNSRVGGWCRSIETGGFTFDYAGHIMFSDDPYVHQLYQMLLGDNVHWQDREAWIYSKNVFTRVSLPGLAVRPAAGGHQGVHRGRDRGTVWLAEAAEGCRQPMGIREPTGIRKPMAIRERTATRALTDMPAAMAPARPR